MRFSERRSAPSLSYYVGRSGSAMQKYRVILHGQNVLTEVEGVRKRLSFYTNVFVEASCVGDAEARALTLIQRDIGLRKSSLNPASDPVRFSVEEVRELDSFDGVQLPRTGLAFYEASSSPK